MAHRRRRSATTGARSRRPSCGGSRPLVASIRPAPTTIHPRTPSTTATSSGAKRRSPVGGLGSDRSSATPGPLPPSSRSARPTPACRRGAPAKPTDQPGRTSLMSRSPLKAVTRRRRSGRWRATRWRIGLDRAEDDERSVADGEQVVHPRMEVRTGHEHRGREHDGVTDVVLDGRSAAATAAGRGRLLDHGRNGHHGRRCGDARRPSPSRCGTTVRRRSPRRRRPAPTGRDAARRDRPWVSRRRRVRRRIRHRPPASHHVRAAIRAAAGWRERQDERGEGSGHERDGGPDGR